MTERCCALVFTFSSLMPTPWLTISAAFWFARCGCEKCVICVPQPVCVPVCACLCVQMVKLGLKRRQLAAGVIQRWYRALKVCVCACVCECVRAFSVCEPYIHLSTSLIGWCQVRARSVRHLFLCVLL